jgi:hypothetical protein
MAVARRPIPACLKMPDNAVFARPQSLHGPLGLFIEIVHPKADDFAAQRVEGLPQQEQFARGVDVGSLPTLTVKRVAAAACSASECERSSGSRRTP